MGLAAAIRSYYPLRWIHSRQFVGPSESVSDSLFFFDGWLAVLAGDWRRREVRLLPSDVGSDEKIEDSTARRLLMLAATILFWLRL